MIIYMIKLQIIQLIAKNINLKLVDAINPVKSNGRPTGGAMQKPRSLACAMCLPHASWAWASWGMCLGALCQKRPTTGAKET
jgi:hypothetical protein